MAFSNTSMKSYRHGKPNIAFVQGYWRVSPLSKVLTRLPAMRDRWHLAHSLAGEWNDELHYKKHNSMESSSIWFHVEHPSIPCVILDSKTYEEHAVVEFNCLVGFAGNKWAGMKRIWVCSKNLLFKSPKEAAAAHDPMEKLRYL